MPEARKGAQCCQPLRVSLDFQLSLRLSFHFQLIVLMIVE